MDKPKTYNEWHSSLQGFEGLRHANCCKISYEAGQQSRQAEVDALNDNHLAYIDKVIAMESDYLEKIEEKDKRIEELELALTQIKSWESHPKSYETAFGSWGLRDFYRDLAEKALRGEHEA